MKNAFLLFTFLSFQFSLFSQNYFQKIYGDASTNKAFSVIVASNGDYIISGQTGTLSTKDILLMRTDSLGNLLWSKSYGTSSSEEGRIVRQTNDGGFLISGYTSGANVDAALIKTDANGNFQWAKKYGDAYYDFSWPMEINNAGDVYLAGWTSPTPTGINDAFIIKTNSSGDTLWTRKFGSTGDDYFRALDYTADGGCIAVGESNSWSTNYDIMVVRLKANGDTLWTKVLGNSSDIDYAWAVRKTLDGGYVIGGNSGVNSGTGDAILIKIDSVGTVKWTKFIGDGNVALNTCRSISQLTSGNILVAGYTGTGGVNEEGLLMMLNSLGDTIWTKKYQPGTAIEHIRNVIEISNGKYLAVGYTSSLGAGIEDVYLLKFNATGFAGGCYQATTNFIVQNKSIASKSSVTYNKTNYLTTSISGSNTLTYTQNLLCDSSITTTIDAHVNLQNTIAVYPNPALDILNVNGIEKGCFVQIVDVVGRLVFEKSNFTSNFLNISDFENGIYFMNVIDKSGNVTNVKFLKQ